jgi:hypothetical protein
MKFCTDHLILFVDLGISPFLCGIAKYFAHYRFTYWACVHPRRVQFFNRNYLKIDICESPESWIWGFDQVEMNSSVWKSKIQLSAPFSNGTQLFVVRKYEIQQDLKN